MILDNSKLKSSIFCEDTLKIRSNYIYSIIVCSTLEDIALYLFAIQDKLFLAAEPFLLELSSENKYCSFLARKRPAYLE